MNQHESEEMEVEKIKLPKYEASHVYLAKDRIIFLKENVTKEVAAELSAWLLYYDNLSSEEDIAIYIHCNGGDADGLIQIYDVMQMINAPIQTICLGKAYSAGAVLLAAGSHGKRFAFKNSKVMIHGIRCAFPIPGQDQATNKSFLDFINKHNDKVMKILAYHTRHTLAEIKADSKRDMYLDAKQAQEYGIIDQII